jgi:hypothetical protein
MPVGIFSLVGAIHPEFIDGKKDIKFVARKSLKMAFVRFVARLVSLCTCR